MNLRYRFPLFGDFWFYLPTVVKDFIIETVQA
jgi:hypothetical protein